MDELPLRFAWELNKTVYLFKGPMNPDLLESQMAVKMQFRNQTLSAVLASHVDTGFLNKVPDRAHPG